MTDNFNSQADSLLADFNRVKDVKRIDSHALNYIGVIYMAKEDYPAAFIAFKGAADLEPKSLFYCLNTARAAVRTDNRVSALVYYKQALRIDPNNKEAAQYVAARRAAIAESEKKESEKKEQERQGAEETKPQAGSARIVNCCVKNVLCFGGWLESKCANQTGSRLVQSCDECGREPSPKPRTKFGDPPNTGRSKTAWATCCKGYGGNDPQCHRRRVEKGGCRQFPDETMVRDCRECKDSRR